MIATPPFTRLILPLLASAALVVSLAGCVVPARGFATVELGTEVEIPMSSDGDTKYDLTVEELQPISAEEIGEWSIQEPGGSSADFEGMDAYFVRYSATGVNGVEVDNSSFVPDKWLLRSTDDKEYRGVLVDSSEEANCQRFRDAAPLGCQFIAVPEGTEIAMVRYMGVIDGPNRGSSLGSEQWAGWTIP